MNLDHMLDRIKDRQWALADFERDAPGADRITDEQFEGLKNFMTDLMWIEQIGARGFAGLARAADDPMLSEIHIYFHADEPSLGALGTILPMLEVALDGALVKFLLDEVADPLCHQVFDKINADESRHLAVDFHVLELLGERHVPRTRRQAWAAALDPTLLSGAVIALPLFGRIGRNVTELGLDEERLFSSLARFNTLGDRSPVVWRNPNYRAIAGQTRGLVDNGAGHRWLTSAAIAASDHLPRRLVRPTPIWIDQLTHEPAA